MHRRFRTGAPGYLAPSTALLCALLAFPAAANWVVQSPAGEQVLDFALAGSQPETLFATTRVDPDTGIWKSIDSGDNWTAEILNNTDYHGVAIKPDNEDVVLVGVRGGAIERSSNGGGAWSATAGGDLHDQWRIHFAAKRPNTAYAAGFSSGVPVSGVLQKSVDSGQNWTVLPIDGDASPAIVSIAVAPSDEDTVYAGAIPDGNNNDGLYRSTDGGNSWTYLSNLPLTEVDGLAVDPTDADVVYAGSAGSGLIRRSTDGGASWQIVHDPFSGGVGNFVSVRGLAINPDDRRIIYALGGSGTTKVIATTDCGDSWDEVDSAGMVLGQPSKAVFDTDNDFIYVLENIVATTIYREALLTAGSGSCDIQFGFPTGGSSSSLDQWLLAMLALLAIVAYRRKRPPSAG